ncbi:hypothetical protein HPB47_020532 [Ixodes persulcatus]|uniref:Uncharacterized protein n=1 Tax=Ixodes persulcatus TaxID=34615 RepID=A0AC60QZM0_IXOPE|nr:hypothetical protein HPB47_020532 [Ixodes persulcatus]
MEIDDFNENDGTWQTVGLAPRSAQAATIIIRFGSAIHLEKIDAHDLGAAILEAARLTPKEIGDTYVKVRSLQNLIAIDTYRTSAESKILALSSLTYQNVKLDVKSYKANNPNNARGVIHGIRPHYSDQYIQAALVLEQAKLLAARRIGETQTILITVEGPRLPRYAFVNRVAYRLYPHRPRSTLCAHCYDIGHRADVCPFKVAHNTCPRCSKRFHLNQDPTQTPHECEPHCVNCKGEHPPNSPLCPKRQQADRAVQQASIERRNAWKISNGSSTRNHSTLTGFSHNYEKWPELPTSNRFSLLQSEEIPHRGSEAGANNPKQKPFDPQFVGETGMHHTRNTYPKEAHTPSSRQGSTLPPLTKTPNPPTHEQEQGNKPDQTNTKVTHLEHPSRSYTQALQIAQENPQTENIAEAIKEGIISRNNALAIPQHTKSTHEARLNALETKMNSLETKVDNILVKLDSFINVVQTSIEANNASNQARDNLIQQIANSLTQISKQVEDIEAATIKNEQLIANLQITRKRHALSPNRPHKALAALPENDDGTINDE